MKREGDKLNLSAEERELLNQAIGTLNQAEIKLEESYEKKNPNQFNSIKKFMIKINNKVMETL
jgi:hypothetical protein